MLAELVQVFGRSGVWGGGEAGTWSWGACEACLMSGRIDVWLINGHQPAVCRWETSCAWCRAPPCRRMVWWSLAVARSTSPCSQVGKHPTTRRWARAWGRNCPPHTCYVAQTLAAAPWEGTCWHWAPPPQLRTGFPPAGESLPVSKSKGDGVIGGTVNGSGMMHIRVRRGGGSSCPSPVLAPAGAHLPYAPGRGYG
jgi:hypothetical protein